MENWKKVLLGGTALVSGLIPLAPASRAQTAPGTIVTQSASKADAATFMTGNSRTSCGTTQDSVANLTLTLTRTPTTTFI